jgi:MFS family permease
MAEDAKPPPSGGKRRPAPAGETAYTRAIERHRSWNFFANVADLAFFNLAMSFVFASTVLPLYASRLVASAVLIGLIPAIHDVSMYLPQIVVARHAEGLSRKKPFVVAVSVFERIPYLFVAVVALFRPGAPPLFSYVLLAASLLVARGAGGVASPAWRAMLGKVIHPDRLGLLFGLGSASGALFGILGAVLVRHILAATPYPTSFGLLFLLCFAAHVFSWTFVALVREPARKPTVENPPFGRYIRDLPAVFRGNPHYTRFLASQALLIFGAMSAGFYIVYARQRFAVDEAYAGTVTLFVLLGQSVAMPLFGLMADRLGHKRQNQLGGLLGVAAVVLALALRGPVLLPLVFVLSNFSLVATRLSRMSLTMEFGAGDRMPTFSALANTILAFPTLLAPVVGGWIIDLAGFHTTFAVALCASAAGFLLLTFGVADPRMSGRRARRSGA